jgi:hypothetical protein
VALVTIAKINLKDRGHTTQCIDKPKNTDGFFAAGDATYRHHFRLMADRIKGRLRVVFNLSATSVMGDDGGGWRRKWSDWSCSLPMKE